ncbi:MAG: acetyl-CoA carboxylase carboxyltransferase subunit alpha [Actinomycetota bacterium]
MAEFYLKFEKPILDMEKRLEELKRLSVGSKQDLSREIDELEAQIGEVKTKVYSKLTPWQRVQIARHPDRPLARDYIELIFHDFVELHGDRLYGDDKAIIGGPAFLDGRAVMVVGQQKGRGTKERVACNFGSPHPEGYRKALRLMKLAEKFKMPVITLIDTQGAYPGVGAEERGQAWAIAENLREMSRLSVPVIAVNIGEGGSGGALAIGVADRLLMLENSWYSVISPEGCASILYKDAGKAPEAAASLKMTADDLKKHGLVDEIIREPVGGAHRAPNETAEALHKAINKHLERLTALSVRELLDKRYERLRAVGAYEEPTNS